MDTIAIIRTEVKWLRDMNNNIRCDSNKAYCRGYDDAFVDLLYFLDTLSEEPDKSMEEAADKYAQMMDEWLKDHDGCFWDGVEEGKKEMKDALMEWAKGRREAVAKEVVIQEGVRLGADAAFEELIDKLNEM